MVVKAQRYLPDRKGDKSFIQLKDQIAYFVSFFFLTNQLCSEALF
jgi:hypothetical protein